MPRSSTLRQTLHFLACGQVDDGKSTLMGRLLHDVGAVPDDQLDNAHVDGALILARITDGLEDERTQGITIDVAYRYFRYKGRSYRITDTPGHVQYTRNMAVAAANSDCVLVLVDAAHGVREQTIRHSRIAAFFGITNFVVAVNKMDLVGFSEARFREIEKQYRDLLSMNLKNIQLTFIPLSGLTGSNVVTPSADMPWHTGKPLMDYLADLEVAAPPLFGARLPIQSIVRLGDTHGYQGMLVDGNVAVGDQMEVAGQNMTVSIATLYHSGHEVKSAHHGQAITLVTNAHTDLSRGDVLYALSAPVLCSDHFTARFLWLDPAYEGHDAVQGVIKIHNHEEQAEIHVRRSDGLMLDAVVSTIAPVPVDLYARHRAMGLFLMINPENEQVMGVGTVMSLTADAPVAQKHTVSV